MIRIIHYVPNLNYTSGIMHFIMNYYRLINKSKIQFHFIYFSKLKQNNFKKEIEQLGGTTHFICPPTKLHIFIESFNKYIKDFKNTYPNDEFIFHNHQLAFTIFQYGILKKNGIHSIIVHNHMTRFSDNILKSIRNMFLFLPVTFLNVKYFACSEGAKKIFKNYNFAKDDDIFLIINGIKCSNFKFNRHIRNKTRAELKIHNEYVLGHIGRMEKVKNQLFLIKLFKEKYNDGKHKLLLIGSGSMEKYIKNKVKRFDISQNTIILKNRTDISNILSTMDCFLFPSKFEGLGLAAVEAQANGLPVILSKHIPPEVSIKNCQIIKNYSVEAWSNAIERCKKKNTHNRSIANKIIENSEFNIIKNINYLENIYIFLRRTDK
jgi:capsular polysaccharide biosynthesis protein